MYFDPAYWDLFRNPVGYLGVAIFIWLGGYSCGFRRGFNAEDR